MSAVLSSVQTMVWLTVFWIFNVHTHVDGCNFTHGMYGHLHWRSTLGEENPLPHWGLEPASLLRLAFQSDALPTELSWRPPSFSVMVATRVFLESVCMNSRFCGAGED